ncbi:MAG TPA: hypothetical protein VHO29_18415 [Marmoricola sp.]|nr:hypothetical protein [Marmoricola sp.]
MVNLKAQTHRGDVLAGVPYGAHLWAVVDRPLQLFAELLRGEFASDPRMCRLAAAEVAVQCEMRWYGRYRLLPAASGSWAGGFAEHRHKCDCETALCSLFLDDRLRAAITCISEAAASAVVWLKPEALARAYALAAVGVATVAAARVTDGYADSLIPDEVILWAREQYDSFLL